MPTFSNSKNHIAIASSPRHAAKGPGQRVAGSSDTWTSSGTWFLWPRILKPSFKGLQHLFLVSQNQFRKGLDPAFDFRKLAFVQEACSMQHEESLISAQSTVNNARRNSLVAAFNLFSTNLQNDWILQDKFLASAEMSSQRARSVLVHSLEAHWPFQKKWDTINCIMHYKFIYYKSHTILCHTILHYTILF